MPSGYPLFLHFNRQKRPRLKQPTNPPPIGRCSAATSRDPTTIPSSAPSLQPTSPNSNLNGHSKPAETSPVSPSSATESSTSDPGTARNTPSTQTPATKFGTSILKSPLAAAPLDR